MRLDTGLRLHKSGPDQACDSYFLFGCRLSTLSNKIPSNGSQKGRSFDFKSRNATKKKEGASRVRDVQLRRSAKNVIDSSDFRLYPSCDTREGRGVGTEDNFGSEKYCLGTIEGRQKAEITRRNSYLRRAAFAPAVPPGRFAPILPPSGSRLAALPPSPALQSRRWRHCVTGKGADPDRQPLPLHCSRTVGATFKELTICSYTTARRVDRRPLPYGTKSSKRRNI